MNQGTVARVALAIEPFMHEAFASFGDTIELGGVRQFPINQGTTIRLRDLVNVDMGEGSHALISLLCGQPHMLPSEVRMLKRHPRGNQTFIPQNDKPHLVVMVPAGGLDPSKLHAFVSRGWQSVDYVRGVWHRPLLALGRANDFLVADRGDEGHNCDEQDLAESVWLTARATQATL